MRITMQMFHDSFLSNMQSNMEVIFKSHEQLSTGKRVNRPSDDPIAISKIVDYKTQISSIGQYQRSINTAKNFVIFLESALSGLSNILIRAKELAVRGATATVDAAQEKLLLQR